MLSRRIYGRNDSFTSPKLFEQHCTTPGADCSVFEVQVCKALAVFVLLVSSRFSHRSENGMLAVFAVSCGVVHGLGATKWFCNLACPNSATKRLRNLGPAGPMGAKASG